MSMLPMQAGPAASGTLIGQLWPAGNVSPAVRAVLLAVAGSALLTLSAKVQIPFWPVPMTMQTFAVLVIGMAYGSRLGAATVALYLLEGAFGLPVFAGTPAKGIGWAYMVGPTGGYLLGFLVSAYVVGLLAERGWDRGVIRTLAANTLGTVVIFGFGLAWLSTIIGTGKAIEFGLIPFLAAAALKIALAAALLPAMWHWIGRRNEAN